jgi:hypothetical protein
MAKKSLSVTYTLDMIVYRPYSRDRTFDFKTRLLVLRGIDLKFVASGERKKDELSLLCMINGILMKENFCITNFQQNNPPESKSW